MIGFKDSKIYFLSKNVNRNALGRK